MSDGIHVAIPTYGRAATINQHVLAYLGGTDIPKSSITLFVANADEAARYSEHCAGYRIVVGLKGLASQRKFINTFYPKGTCVFSFDDDVSGVESLVFENPVDAKNKTLATPCSLQLCQSLHRLLEEGFTMAHNHGIRLWGFYPVRNKGFMNPCVSTGLKFIMGHAFGFHAGDPAFDRIEQYSMKDDYYLSLYHMQHGRGTLRFDGLCVRSKQHTGAGGTCDDMERKLKINNGSVMKLCGEFPSLATYKTRRTSDPWLSRYLELRLRNVTTSQRHFVFA